MHGQNFRVLGAGAETKNVHTGYTRIFPGDGISYNPNFGVYVCSCMCRGIMARWSVGPGAAVPNTLNGMDHPVNILITFSPTMVERMTNFRLFIL